MGVKAGTVIDKISEIRSRISVLEGLILYLRTNYLSSDSGDAEMRFSRSDYATVPEVHVESTINEIEVKISEARDELENWENLSLEAEEALEGGKIRKKTNRKDEDAAIGRNQDQPAPVGVRRTQAR